MERIPSPYPDKEREGHYLDVFNTPIKNKDGSPREIDDYLPRARVKKLFAAGNLHSSDKQTLTDLSKELCVPVNLLQDSIQHYEELKILSAMRARKRKQNKDNREAKLYKDYDWPYLIKSGDLKQLVVKELEKYMVYHNIPCKNLSKNGKLECIRCHYYASQEDESVNPDQSSEEEWTTDTSEDESDVGEDTVLNEIGSSESDEEEENEEVDERVLTRSGRRIVRRLDTDCLYY